jgi:hypothetical protein
MVLSLHRIEGYHNYDAFALFMDHLSANLPSKTFVEMTCEPPFSLLSGALIVPIT